MTDTSAPTIDVNVYVDRTRESVVVYGQLDNLFNAYRDHRLALGQDIDPVVESNMETVLAVAQLYQAAQPPDLFSAWTLNMKDPLCNYFVAGTNSDWSIVGQVFTKDVKPLKNNDCTGRIFLQVQRPHCEPALSAVEVTKKGILSAMEEFCNRALQIPTRLFEPAPGQFVFIQGMPRVNRDWIFGLDCDAAAEYIKSQDLELVEERHYTFRCGCNMEMITHMLAAQFKNRPGELFRGDQEVQVNCPRCGHIWHVTQEDFKKAC